MSKQCSIFNACAENTYEIKTEKDFRNTNEQNSALIVDDDCRVKVETDDIPNTDLSLLGSLKEQIIIFQNNDDNNQYHTKE